MKSYHAAKENMMMHLLRDLEDMLEICVDVSLCDSPEEVMAMMESNIKELLSTDRCSLYIYDRGANVLWTKFASGLAPVRLPMNSGVAAWVAKNAKSAYIDDAYSDERFNDDVDRASGYKTHNVLCVPVFNSEERCVAVLQILNKVDADNMPAPFQTQDRVLVHLLGRHLGVVLQDMKRSTVLTNGLNKLTELNLVSQRLCSVTQGMRRNFDVVRLAQRAEETAKEILDTMYARVLFLEHKHIDQVVNMRHFGDEANDPDKEQKLWYVKNEISELTFKDEPTRVWASTTSGISGYVLTTGKCMDVEHPNIDDRFHSEQDLETCDNGRF